MSKLSMYIIGNGPVSRDFSREIDQCDKVVRFNGCGNYNQGTGKKTSILCVNYMSMKSDFLDKHNAREVWVLDPPDSPRETIWRRIKNLVYKLRGEKYYQGLRKKGEYRKLLEKFPGALVFDTAFYSLAQKKIRTQPNDLREPSSGFLALE